MYIYIGNYDAIIINSNCISYNYKFSNNTSGSSWMMTKMLMLIIITTNINKQTNFAKGSSNIKCRSTLQEIFITT